jgi:1-acyl-sn-glycerol-3-phosphate acyltransferase
MNSDTATKSQPASSELRYDHSRLEAKRRILRFFIKYIGFSLLARVDQVEGIENLPAQGPAILMINHINIVDPVLVIHLLPRNIVPLAKIEVYDYPLIGILPKLWEVIPVRREEIDRNAIQKIIDVLKAGEIVLVAPEGTRNPELQQAHVGVAYLASRTQVPVIPVAISNTLGYPTIPFSPRWRKPGARVRFGRPFRYQTGLARAGRDALRLMTDEAMYVLSNMLPPEQRGFYSDLTKATRETIAPE